MYTYTPQGNGEDGASPPASLAGQEATAAVLQRMFHRSVSSSAEPTGISVASPTPLGFGTGVARPMALEQPPASPPTDFSMLGTLAAPMTMASITELSRQVDELSVREPRSEPGAGDFGELPTSPFSMERDARRERHSWTSDGTPAVDARRMRDMQHASANLKERPSPARSTYNGYGEDSYHGAVHDSEGLLDSLRRSYERGYGHITPLEDAQRLPFPHSPAYANTQHYDCNGPSNGSFSPASPLGYEDSRRLVASASAELGSPAVDVLTSSSASTSSPSPLEDPRRLPDDTHGPATGASLADWHTGPGAGSEAHSPGHLQPRMVVRGSPAISAGTTTPSPLEDPRRLAPAFASISAPMTTSAPASTSMSTSCEPLPSSGPVSPLYHVRSPPSWSQPSSAASSPMEDARRLLHRNGADGAGTGQARHPHYSAFPVVPADVLGSNTLLNPAFPRPFDGGFVNPDFSGRTGADAHEGAYDYSPLEEHRRLGSHSSFVTKGFGQAAPLQAMASPLLHVGNMSGTPLEDQRRLPDAAPSPINTNPPSGLNMIGSERFELSPTAGTPVEDPRRLQLWEDPRGVELREEMSLPRPESYSLSPGVMEDPRRL